MGNAVYADWSDVEGFYRRCLAVEAMARKSRGRQKQRHLRRFWDMRQLWQRICVERVRPGALRLLHQPQRGIIAQALR